MSNGSDEVSGPAWHSDPDDDRYVRWWDGEAWTDQRMVTYDYLWVDAAIGVGTFASHHHAQEQWLNRVRLLGMDGWQVAVHVPLGRVGSSNDSYPGLLFQRVRAPLPPSTRPPEE